MLQNVAPGVSVWLGQPLARGVTNAGIVVEADGITVIDTLIGGSRTEACAAAVESIGLPVRRVVLTSSHVPYVGGAGRFRLAAVYGTSQISAHLDQPPNIAGYRQLYPDVAHEFDDMAARAVSHVVVDAAWLTPAIIAVPTTGQIEQNLVLQVPGAGVVFAGAMCSFGVRPLAFDGDPAAWADALDRVVALGDIIVPGQGPVGSPADVAILQQYLRACVDAAGDARRLGTGPWERWACPEFDAVNVERAAILTRGERVVPPSMRPLLGID
ncbi:MAG TPA: MBL fold metallo-hydrolase [Acidimicrobiales bacterium]|nr:MBL fold metallo-hydrolase [Acidimicrobiales bacterium]